MKANSTCSYKDLIVWQKAIELGKLIYQLTKTFPSEEKFGLVAQMRRAVVSIPSNIAEGYGRAGRREYLQFLSVVQGSLKELETQTILAQKLAYVTSSQAERVLSESEVVGKMLGSLIRSLKAKDE